MSDVVIASNVSLKVNRAISGATTVNANCYAIVTYSPNSTAPSVNISTAPNAPITRYFGPGQSVPASFTTTAYDNATASTLTWGVLSGVEFINSP
jgi:hypothetical protein